MGEGTSRAYNRRISGREWIPVRGSLRGGKMRLVLAEPLKLRVRALKSHYAIVTSSWMHLARGGMLYQGEGNWWTTLTELIPAADLSCNACEGGIEKAIGTKQRGKQNMQKFREPQPHTYEAASHNAELSRRTACLNQVSSAFLYRLSGIYARVDALTVGARCGVGAHYSLGLRTQQNEAHFPTIRRAGSPHLYSCSPLTHTPETIPYSAYVNARWELRKPLSRRGPRV